MQNKKFNLLNAFYNIVHNADVTINPAKISSNRINNVGDALEGYVKDSIVGLLGESSNEKRDKLYSEAFSWLGNTGNPPDCILKNDDAIEVKKLKSLNGEIALNSSYPKSKLHADDIRIAKGAITAEEWDIKDIVYIIGSTTNNSELQRLWFLYGDCYAASKEIYENLINKVEKRLASSSDLEFQETNELGRINKVDPLGITNMRIRGMWHILNPSRLYSQFISKTENKQFYFLLREKKYKSFPIESRKKIESIKKDGFAIEKIEIRDPDNPAKLIKAILIKYEI